MQTLSRSAVGCKPFTSAAAPAARRSVVAAATRRVSEARSMRQQQRAQLRVRSAEPTEEAAAPAEAVEAVEAFEDERGPRRSAGQDKPEFKHFLPLPKPAHLVYIKPTVAVVADMAPRSSVGLKMTAGDNQLERYVIEFYSKSVK